MAIRKIKENIYQKEITIKETRLINKSSLEAEKERLEARLKEVEEDLKEISHMESENKEKAEANERN